ncbi:uncharacterized protein LOC126843227 [Adelges cooleyi]|uniref:uncharacterized protein LOC126843227 n=1 Tax=Adelges cooleyi TaxID=133065 RepID=UPI002180235D|nr:uncharacterized protein LOC126843227 [Adelges cooleyi]XP_050436563.1 uncharacterized protein LOC126843227 [Adelges cooleyi]XP_050436564.1 uncharacterized protein LOC126843227 [Adelges cooleyi]
MKFNGLRLLSVLLVCSLDFVAGHSYHLDGCPDFYPMPEFVMDKFLGRWYAVQTTWPPSQCLIYDFDTMQKLENTNCVNCVNCTNCINCTNCRNCSNCVNCIECTNCRDCTNGIRLSNCADCTNCIICPSLHKWQELVESSHSIVTNSIGYNFFGELKVNPNIPSIMSMSDVSPLSLDDQSSLIVFATDYVNYAGVYSCQQMPFGHQHYVVILSRSKKMNDMYLYKMIDLLISAKVNLTDLTFIDQTFCYRSKDELPATGTFDVLVFAK